MVLTLMQQVACSSGRAPYLRRPIAHGQALRYASSMASVRRPHRASACIRAHVGPDAFRIRAITAVPKNGNGWASFWLVAVIDIA